MPSGRVHACLTVLAAGGILTAGSLVDLPTPTVIAMTSGCLAGLLITPDLDVDVPVNSHTVVRRHAGLLPWLAWRLLWLPYAKTIPHRHWLSHAPVIGTLIRVAYMSAVIWLILTLLGIPFPWHSPPGWTGWALSGLMIADAVHWAADLWYSSVRRAVRRFIRLAGG